MIITDNSNIYLIGYRACGKTTVGRLIASIQDMEFVDTDAVAVSMSGCEIAELVKREGWECFRNLETLVLDRLASAVRTAVSCGGGIILRPENRKILSSSFTVYLEAPAEVLAERLSADPEHGQRPSLTGDGIVAEVREVLKKRERFYRDSAFVTVDATRPPEEVAAEIIRKFNEYKAGD